MAEDFDQKEHALFLGRGNTLSGRHGRSIETKRNFLHPCRSLSCRRIKARPSCVVDSEMPVVAVAPNDDLLRKITI